MVAAGELTADDRGRYRLAGPLAERQRRQLDARRHRASAWDGRWEMAIVVGDARTAEERAQLRSAAVRRKLGEVREGVWARPANLDPRRSPADAAIVADQCVLVHAVPEEPGPLVAAFELEGWADAASALLEELRRSQPTLDEEDVSMLPDAFVLAAAGVRHVAADPQTARRSCCPSPGPVLPCDAR